MPLAPTARQEKATTMNARVRNMLLVNAALLAAMIFIPSALAQPAARPPRDRGPQGPQVASPEVSADRHVTFRILAPKAEAVRLNGSVMPGHDSGAAMAKGTNGLWEATLGPIEPGAYRYNFGVAGDSAIDREIPPPASPTTTAVA